jgi:hypothetical protein
VNTEKQLNTLFNKYNKDASKDAANFIHLHLQPLSDIHFNSLYASFDSRLAHKPTLYGLLAVAAFLLILAVHQLYQSYNSQCCKPCKRDWHTQNNGQFEKAAYPAIFRRNIFANNNGMYHIILFSAAAT